MTSRNFAILEAPSVLGLFPRGVETLPQALLSAGLAERLEASHAGRVDPPPYDAERDPGTLLLNPRGIADYSVALADAVGSLLDEKAFAAVLGGDCSILLGNLLALKRRGRYGLLFIDGHADFYQPEADPNGEAASMDLALATGRGPPVVTNIENRRPLVQDDDVTILTQSLMRTGPSPGSSWRRSRRGSFPTSITSVRDEAGELSILAGPHSSKEEGGFARGVVSVNEETRSRKENRDEEARCSGKRPFGDGARPAGLQLTKSATSTSGVIIATYEPAGEIEKGSFAFEEPTESEVRRREALKY